MELEVSENLYYFCVHCEVISPHSWTCTVGPALSMGPPFDSVKSGTPWSVWMQFFHWEHRLIFLALRYSWMRSDFRVRDREIKDFVGGWVFSKSHSCWSFNPWREKHGYFCLFAISGVHSREKSCYFWPLTERIDQENAVEVFDPVIMPYWSCQWLTVMMASNTFCSIQPPCYQNKDGQEVNNGHLIHLLPYRGIDGED